MALAQKFLTKRVTGTLFVFGKLSNHSAFFRFPLIVQKSGAWRKFSKGKRTDSEVAKFELNLEREIFSLHEQLASGIWKNDQYVCRRIADPKPRTIHIASVRDRVLFQAIYQELYQIFDRSFIHDSYASRENKGTHAGVNRFEIFARKVSAHYTKPTFVLKCDIRKFLIPLTTTVQSNDTENTAGD